MTKHTPWKIGTDLFAAKHVYDAGGDRLTNEHRSGAAEWDEICHLIAAAPDLLEALEKIVFDWDGEPEDMFDARDAIAKAKGESQ